MECSALIAVMNPAAMSAQDLAAVRHYLAGFAHVISVDASACTDAQALYEMLRRYDGRVAGVQLFGTPDMVPAFRIQYKVQLTAGVDEGGRLCTDLFYGNLQNDVRWLGESYNVKEHLLHGWPVDLVPRWPVARLPLKKGEFKPFLDRYEAFCRRSGFSPLDKAVFYNPLLPARRPMDDMGRFLKRLCGEMDGIRYRLYGNLKGDYPVIAHVLGDFSAENMALENARGAWEYILCSHGQRDNIDACYYENREEKRLSTLNMQNIHAVLGQNPYYLDACTCLIGFDMADNLATAALNGRCMGVFAATTILSTNGMDWQASLQDMARSNFYYFYYHYFKALHGGACRSRAFWLAQQAYAIALLEDAKRPLRAVGNVQFNLYNLLCYHNFGVMEPV